MLRKLPFVVLLLAALLVPALAAGGDAYVWVVVEGGPTASIIGTVPISYLGGTLYYTQQDALAAFDAATATNTGNWYIWVCLDGACVPVDPYTVGN